MKKTNYEVFIESVENVFSGCKFQYEKILREIYPTILSTRDLLGYIDEPKNPYEMYLKQLPESFKRAARSELYRADTGWIPKSKHERRVLHYPLEGQSYLVEKPDRKMAIYCFGLRCDIILKSEIFEGTGMSCFRYVLI